MRAFGGLLLGVLAALVVAAPGPARALAAPGDGACTVMPGTISNLTPTLVTLRSASDDAIDPISAHVAIDQSLAIRDPGGTGTSRPNERLVSASELTALGENIGFLLPAANIAGEFEVLTPASEETSDCTGGVAGIYDGLAIGQAEVLQLRSEATGALTVTVRGTSKGVPLRALTTVTLSTSRGEFVAVNGEAVEASKVVQLTLTAQPPSEGAAVGTVDWRSAPGERPGPATMTATALQDGTSLFKTVMGSIMAPPLTGATGFVGILPGSGQTALMVTTRTVATVDLTAALEAATCKPLSVAILEAGAWDVYVPGAPGAINESFEKSLAAETPFVVRCS